MKKITIEEIDLSIQDCVDFYFEAVETLIMEYSKRAI